MKRNAELMIAWLIVALLTVVYLLASSRSAIGPGSPIGHWIGIIGFLLMLMTEVLYSLRKQGRGFHWGRMETWLSFHVITGIVGPYMVFLHTGFRFIALAGIVMWLTVVVVASGFVGRYIYAALPRTPAGAEMEAGELEIAIQRGRVQLQTWLSARPPALRVLATEMVSIPATTGAGLAALLSRPWFDRQYHRQWRRSVRELGRLNSSHLAELDRLLRHYRRLHRQGALLATARRLMALWHAVHVPVALTLFILACAHIVAALFFG